MRISDRLRNEITTSLVRNFGYSEAFLFGSRAKSTGRGGDIDVAVSGEFTQEQFRACKARFMADLLRKDLDLNIDIVQISRAPPLLLLEIYQNGLPLLSAPVESPDQIATDVQLNKKEHLYRWRYTGMCPVASV